MEIDSREISYSKDSQRVKNPEQTLEDVLEDLRSDMGIEIEELQHGLAPELKTAVVHGNYGFYWRNRTATRGKGLTSEQSRASAVSEYIERYVSTEFLGSLDEDRDPENEKVGLEKLLPPYEEALRTDNKLMELYTDELGMPCPVKQRGWLDRLYMLHPDANGCGCWSGFERLKAVLGLGSDIGGSDKRGWIDFYSVTENRKVDLPLQYVANGTNGFASGNCLEEAALHGITEVIERDEAARQLPVLDTETLEDNSYIPTEDIPEEVRSSFDEEMLDRIMLIHSRSEICPEVHVVQAITVFEPENRNLVSPNVNVFLGKGASLDPEYALQRALTETFQGVSSLKAESIIEPEPGFEPSYRRLEDLEDNSTGDLASDIERIDRNTESEIFIRELPDHGFDISVVKCAISDALGPSVPKIGRSFYEDALDIDLSFIEKQGVRMSRVHT